MFEAEEMFPLLSSQLFTVDEHIKLPCELCYMNQEVYHEVYMIRNLNLDMEYGIETVKEMYHWLIHQQENTARSFIYKILTRDLVRLKVLTEMVMADSLGTCGGYMNQLCMETIRSRYVQKNFNYYRYMYYGMDFVL